jgi:hypothetical protein
MAKSRNRKLVPECEPAIQQMKYEIGAELGIPIGGYSSAGNFDAEMAGELGSLGNAPAGSNYLGFITARDAGRIGGTITKRLVQQAEQTAQNTVI